MKFIFASDLHGSLFYTNKMIEKYNEKKAEKIILLGDLLYHGPRNPLPKDYNPAEVAKLLFSYRDNIIAIRGNCDSEVDEMVTGISNRADYALLYLNNIEFFATHGHLNYSPENRYYKPSSVYIYGHIHIPLAYKDDKGVYILNPGSTSLPKEGNVPSYAVLEENIFRILSFEDELIKEIVIE